MRPKKAPRLHEPPHQFPLSLCVCTVVWKAITEPFLFFAGGNTEAQGTNCKERRRLILEQVCTEKRADVWKEVLFYKNWAEYWNTELQSHYCA